jgi:hypothetical protein
MQSDNFGLFVGLEVTSDGFSRIGSELIQIKTSVKIDSPKARAVKPPSGASSTRKIISLIYLNIANSKRGFI